VILYVSVSLDYFIFRLVVIIIHEFVRTTGWFSAALPPLTGRSITIIDNMIYVSVRVQFLRCRVRVLFGNERIRFRYRAFVMQFVRAHARALVYCSRIVKTTRTIKSDKICTTHVLDVGGRRVRARETVHVADAVVVRVAFARLAFRRRRGLGDPFGENLQKLFHQVQVVGFHFFRREQRTCDGT